MGMTSPRQKSCNFYKQVRHPSPFFPKKTNLTSSASMPSRPPSCLPNPKTFPEDVSTREWLPPSETMVAGSFSRTAPSIAGVEGRAESGERSRDRSSDLSPRSDCKILPRLGKGTAPSPFAWCMATPSLSPSFAVAAAGSPSKGTGVSSHCVQEEAKRLRVS